MDATVSIRQPFCSRFFHFRIGLIAHIFVCGVWTAHGEIAVEVSNTYSAIHHSVTLEFAVDHQEIIELPEAPISDSYNVHFTVQSGHLAVFCIDKRDVNADNPSPKLLYDVLVTGTDVIQLPPSPSSAGMVLVFSNIEKLPVHAQLTVIRSGTRGTESIDGLHDLILGAVNATNAAFLIPDFKVVVAPCGFVNAYSGPNIVICTELLADLDARGLGKALRPILIHELAHSLLYLWGLPGYDNEDLADSFAASVCDPEDIEALILWFESRDPVAEAVLQIVNGSRHSLSIQRARNMRKSLEHADDLIDRWDRMLKPYARRIP